LTVLKTSKCKKKECSPKSGQVNVEKKEDGFIKWGRRRRVMAKEIGVVNHEGGGRANKKWLYAIRRGIPHV